MPYYKTGFIHHSQPGDNGGVGAPGPAGPQGVAGAGGPPKQLIMAPTGSNSWTAASTTFVTWGNVIANTHSFTFSGANDDIVIPETGLYNVSLQLNYDDNMPSNIDFVAGGKIYSFEYTDPTNVLLNFTIYLEEDDVVTNPSIQNGGGGSATLLDGVFCFHLL